MGVALEGVPGIGKTTLWRDALDSARRRGYRVLVTAPGEPDSMLAFAGLGDLLDGDLDLAQAGLPDPQRNALAAALSLDGGSEAGSPDPLALPRAVRTVLRRIAANGPLVVAIDDEQWLDRASARVLAFALCRLRDDPVCVLLTRRVQSGGALWPELARGFGSGGLQTLAVDALDLPTTRRAAASSAGADDPEAGASPHPRGLGREPALRVGDRTRTGSGANRRRRYLGSSEHRRGVGATTPRRRRRGARTRCSWLRPCHARLLRFCRWSFRASR